MTMRVIWEVAPVSASQSKLDGVDEDVEEALAFPANSEVVSFEASALFAFCFDFLPDRFAFAYSDPRL